MPTPAQDLADLRHPVMAGNVKTVLETPNPPNVRCGGQTAAHCTQRRVLIQLGYLPSAYYETSKPKGGGKAGILRLQAALASDAGAMRAVTVAHPGKRFGIDGAWGPMTNTAIQWVVSDVLKKPVSVAQTDKSTSTSPPPPTGGGGSGRQPADKGREGSGQQPADKGRILPAGIPWMIPAGLAALGVIGFLTFKFGKKKGLSGCNCGVGNMNGAPEGTPAGDNEDDLPEDIPAEMAEAIQAIRSIPDFKPAKPAEPTKD